MELDQHFNQKSTNFPSIHTSRSIPGRPIFDQLIWVGQHSVDQFSISWYEPVDSQPTINRLLIECQLSIEWMSIKYWSRCLLRVEFWSTLDRRYLLLVHMIQMVDLCLMSLWCWGQFKGGHLGKVNFLEYNFDLRESKSVDQVDQRSALKVHKFHKNGPISPQSASSLNKQLYHVNLTLSF